MNKNAVSLEEKVTEFSHKTCQELSDIFGVEIGKPEIHLLHSRSEIDKIWGKKTEPWLVAIAAKENKNTISILSEDKFETESNHPREHFWKILKHECVHLFYEKMAKGEYRPLWLNEGIAQILAGQKKQQATNETLMTVNKYFSYFDSKCYPIGYFWVSHLIGEYGKEKIIKLIKTIKPKVTPEQFHANFEKVYGFKFDEKYLRKAINEGN